MEIVALQIQHEGALADFVSEFASVGEEDIPAFSFRIQIGPFRRLSRDSTNSPVVKVWRRAGYQARRGSWFTKDGSSDSLICVTG